MGAESVLLAGEDCRDADLRGGSEGGGLAAPSDCSKVDTDAFLLGRGGGVAEDGMEFRLEAEAGVLGRLGWGEIVGCSGRRRSDAVELVGDCSSKRSVCLLARCLLSALVVDSDARLPFWAGEARGATDDDDGFGATGGLEGGALGGADPPSNIRKRSFTLS